jgi:hypothetical protein
MGATTTSAGQTDSLGNLGHSALKEPIVPQYISHEVKPPTGEPDAGDPPARFGGRGGTS